MEACHKVEIMATLEKQMMTKNNLGCSFGIFFNTFFFLFSRDFSRSIKIE